MSLTSLIRRVFPSPQKITKYIRHFRAYNKANTRPEFKASLRHMFSVIWDWNNNAGSLDYYFWQDLWAARKIYRIKPAEHFDIGSSIKGFIAHILPFMNVTMIDIRPLPFAIEGLKFIQADATNLDGIADKSLISLSSLCAPEHFGLGRYGDPVDPEACFMAMKSMQRVLALGGRLYIAVPVGNKSGVAFNAHRIFAPELVASTLSELRLEDFAVINGMDYREHVSFEDFHAMKTGTDYSGKIVGLFEFVRE